MISVFCLAQTVVTLHRTVISTRITLGTHSSCPQPSAFQSNSRAQHLDCGYPPVRLGFGLDRLGVTYSPDVLFTSYYGGHPTQHHVCGKYHNATACYMHLAVRI